MTFHTWVAFTVAAWILLVLPGPTIISVISLSLAHGRRAVLPLVIGVTLGDFTAMTLSLLGLGVLLAASATLFSIMKLLGGFYLVYLGVKLWRSDQKMETPGASSTEVTSGSLITRLFVVTALNPKSIAFFVAFLPQFVNPGERVLPQFLVLGGTFLFFAALNAGLYGFFAGHLRERLRNAQTRRWLDRCGGTALIGAGFLTAAMRRSS